MPRKPQYTKEEIAQYGLRIVREQGMSCLTAREMAKYLGTTVAPIFVHYASMDELKQAVRTLAQNVYREYIRQGIEYEIPLLGVGMHYIQFAKQEPELYRLLFLSDNVFDAKESHYAMEVLHYTQDLVRESIQRIYHMDALAADHYFRDLLLVAHSFGTLLVTGGCTYTDEEIGAIFTEISLSICKAYKEIPGLVEGEYNSDEEFRKVIYQE